MVELENRVRRDSEPVADQVLGVFLFGSSAEGAAHPGSDVDACVVGGPGRDPAEVLRHLWRTARLAATPYDLRVFEELPLYLKAEVLERGRLLLSNDEPALSESLRRWRKVWADQAHRNRMAEEDVRRMLAARRALDPGRA